MIRRKWSLPGWAIAALLSLLVVGTIATGVAMPDTIQGVRDRYDQNIHTVTRTVQPFKQVDVEQGAAGIHVQYAVDPSLRNASAYKVDVRYLGDAPVGDIKTSVKDTTLTIDARGFKPGTDWDCDGLCIGARDYFEVTVYTPQPLAEPDLTAKPTDPKAAPIIE
jgi:hypothetical protein